MEFVYSHKGRHAASPSLRVVKYPGRPPNHYFKNEVLLFCMGEAVGIILCPPLCATIARIWVLPDFTDNSYGNQESTLENWMVWASFLNGECLP